MDIWYRITNNSVRTRRLGQSDWYLLSSHSAAGVAISYTIANSSARTHQLGQSGRYSLHTDAELGGIACCYGGAMVGWDLGTVTGERA